MVIENYILYTDCVSLRLYNVGVKGINMCVDYILYDAHDQTKSLYPCTYIVSAKVAGVGGGEGGAVHLNFLHFLSFAIVCKHGHECFQPEIDFYPSMLCMHIYKFLLAITLCYHYRICMHV